MSRLARVRSIGCCMLLLGLLAAGDADPEPGAERAEPAHAPAAAPTPGGARSPDDRGAAYALMSGGAGSPRTPAAALEAARRFYVARDDALAWVSGGTLTPRGRALVD